MKRALSINDRYRQLWFDVIIRAIRDYKCIGAISSNSNRKEEATAKSFLESQSTWDLAGLDISAEYAMRVLTAVDRDELIKRLRNYQEEEEEEEEDELAEPIRSSEESLSEDA